MPTDRPTKARTRDAAAVNGKWERRNGRSRVNWGFHLGQKPAGFWHGILLGKCKFHHEC